MPETKEGWIYIGLMMIPFLAVSVLPVGENIKTAITFGWMAIMLIDVIEIMAKMKKDEREKAHEAIAERNALWFMLIVIVGGFFYRTIEAGLKEQIYIDPVLVLALLGGAMVKSISHWKLREK